MFSHRLPVAFAVTAVIAVAGVAAWERSREATSTAESDAELKRGLHTDVAAVAETVGTTPRPKTKAATPATAIKRAREVATPTPSLHLTDSPRAVSVAVGKPTRQAVSRHRATPLPAEATRATAPAAALVSARTESLMPSRAERVPLSVSALARISPSISSVRTDVHSTDAVVTLNGRDTTRIRLADVVRLPILPRVAGAARIP